MKHMSSNWVYLWATEVIPWVSGPHEESCRMYLTTVHLTDRGWDSYLPTSSGPPEVTLR